MSDRARNLLHGATAVTFAAGFVFIVGAIALAGVNLSLAFGVWSESLGVPLVAALAAFSVIECWVWLAARLRVATWPAWRTLAGVAALAYLIFFAAPVANAYLGRAFLIGVVILAFAAPAALVRLAQARGFDQNLTTRLKCFHRENKRAAFAALSVVELAGLEPATSWVRSRRSPS